METYDFPSETVREKVLVCKDISDLRAHLDDKAFTSVELVGTYIFQAATKGMELCALADIDFENAIKQAKEMDRLSEAGISKGFFHGIPFSVKD